MQMALSSIGKLMVVVAILAIACAATALPSLDMITLLLYTRVSLLLWATFRARYGRARDSAWWFGFAAFGWSHFAISLWSFHMPPPVVIGFPNYFDPRDMVGTIGTRIYYLLQTRSNRWTGLHVQEAARFWMTIGVGLIGGFVSKLVAGRAGSS